MGYNSAVNSAAALTLVFFDLLAYRYQVRERQWEITRQSQCVEGANEGGNEGGNKGGNEGASYKG